MDSYWPLQTCLLVPGKLCSDGPTEYSSLEQCCQKSFPKGNGPIRGARSGDSYECYLAPSALDPPCWLAESIKP